MTDEVDTLPEGNFKRAGKCRNCPSGKGTPGRPRPGSDLRDARACKPIAKGHEARLLPLQRADVGLVQGVMMVFRSSAAICGALITLAISSVAMAGNEIHSNAVDNAASGAAIVGAASMYNPYRPGYREGGPDEAL